VAYVSAKGRIEVYGQGKELVEEGNALLAPGEWQETAGRRRLGEFSPGLLALQARSADGNLWLVAYTFQVAGWQTTSEPLAQLAYGTRSLLRPVPAGVVAVAARCGQDCEMAQALIATFWDDMSARILAVVPDGSRTI
jgi:hypothetical protein